MRENKSQNSICQVLKSVIQLGRQGVDTGLHHGIHQQLQLLLRQSHVEPVPQSFDRGCTIPEAGQLGVGLQDLDQGDQFLMMLPGCNQSLQDQDFEVGKHVTSQPSHHLHVIRVRVRVGVYVTGETERFDLDS